MASSWVSRIILPAKAPVAIGAECNKRRFSIPKADDRASQLLRPGHNSFPYCDQVQDRPTIQWLAQIPADRRQLDADLNLPAVRLCLGQAQRPANIFLPTSFLRAASCSSANVAFPWRSIYCPVCARSFSNRGWRNQQGAAFSIRNQVSPCARISEEPTSMPTSSAIAAEPESTPEIPDGHSSYL